MNQAGWRVWRIGVLAVVACSIVWGGWRWWHDRLDRRAIAEIQREVDAGRYGTGARKLEGFLAANPDSEQALYLLGTCEMSRGRLQAADAAWSRIPPGSPLAPRAILGRMQLEAAQGRLAMAEQVVKEALDDPRFDAASLPILLGPLYTQQGRLEEARRLVAARWDRLNSRNQAATEPAVDLIRLHIELPRRPVPVEAARAALEEAARSAPDDDRVWLAKANLATRTGAYDEADRWLLACLRKRPGDAAVWIARLDWAIAANRVDEVREALGHIPVEESSPVQVARLAAWLAARTGDPTWERRALERLVAVDPSDFAALDRLVGLAVAQGQPARAEELRSRKAEITRLQARYDTLYHRKQPYRDAAEMARLAERLGRRFEARAFAALALAVDPDRDDLRRDLAHLTLAGPLVEDKGRTLADVLESAPDSSPSLPRSSAADSPSRRPDPPHGTARGPDRNRTPG